MTTGGLKKIAALMVFAVLMLNLFAVSASTEGWRGGTINIGGVYNDNGWVSIDITKKDDVSLALQFMDTQDSGERVSIAVLRFTESGKLAFRSNGGWLSAEDGNNETYHRAEFKSGVKYNLKMNHNREAGIIEWFLDDKKIGETTTKDNVGLCDQVWVMCTTENVGKLSWTVNEPEKNSTATESYEVDEEALAEEAKLFGEMKDSADSRAVQLLNALGIMGTEAQSGKFWDETPVKRREIAQILCNLFKFEVFSDETPRFNDVPEEYRGYVETVVRNGYMSGYGDGRFGANDYVTNAQLTKIFVTVLDGDNIAELSGGFPMGYIKIARQMGISLAASRGNDEPARRIDVANMIYSTLEADIMKLVSINEKYLRYATVEGYTFLSEMLDIYRYEGVVTRNEATSLDNPGGAGEKIVQIGDTIHMDPDGLAADYLGSSVIAYVYTPDDNKSGNVVCITESLDNETLIIEKDDVIGAKGFKLEYYDGDKKKDVTLSPGTNMIYNGKAIEYDAAEFDVDTGYIKLVNNNGDEMFDVVLVTEYETFVVEKVNPSTKTISAKFGKDSIELEGNLYTIMRNGVPAELNKIGVGEVVSAAISNEDNGERVIKIEACSNRVTGPISKMFKEDGDNYIEVEGSEYRIGTYCEKLMSDGILPKLNVGDEVQFFTDIYNNIVYFNVNTSGRKVGYLVRAALEENAFSADLKVTIYNSSDEFEELAASDKLKINGEKMELAALDTELKDKLSEGALVEYSQKDGALTALNFAADGYDVSRFSLDDSYTKRGKAIKCSATSVLDNKYSVTAATQVFIVPKGTTDIMEPAYYYIKTGSHFRGNWNYNVELYDINSDGEVKYAVIEQSPLTSSSLNEGHSIIVVKELYEAADEDGDIVPVICGMAENGKEIELTGIDMKQAEVRLAGTSETRYIKAGDVIQYVNDHRGKLAAIKLIHDVESDAYYLPTAVEETKSAYTVTKCFGQVIRATSSQIFMSTDGLWENMTPLDTDMLVNNTGTAVYLYDSARETLTPAAFSDADRGDTIFACVNYSNKTRMLVIYK